MKTASAKSCCMNSLKRFSAFSLNWKLALALAVGPMIAASAVEIGKTFATPEAAVAALLAAASAEDTNAFRVIFGPAAEEIENPDRVQAANELGAFNAAAKQHQRIVHESDSRCVLELGENSWPFPVPIVKRDGKWYFDTEAGKEEILSRRIGKNELATLQSIRACIEAQREYASKDRNGDEVLEYAGKFSSSPGTKDGLYWPPDLDGEISPLGPLVADAHREGYAGRKSDAEVRPFHGYYFKILKEQGRHTPGGKYKYVINGHMIAGFALIAWPADYGESGVMTFMANQQGKVYQKNLGPKTGKIAAETRAYDPDTTWSLSPD